MVRKLKTLKMKNKKQGFRKSFKELATAVGYISLVTVMIFMLLICYLLFTGCSSSRHTNKEKTSIDLDSTYNNSHSGKNSSWKTDKSTTDINSNFDTTVRIKGQTVKTPGYDKDSLLKRLEFYDLLFDLEGNEVTINKEGKGKVNLRLKTKDTSIHVQGRTTTHIQNNIDLKTEATETTTQQGRKTVEERKIIKTTERKSDYTKWAIWATVIVVVGVIIFFLVKRVNFKTLLSNIANSFKKK